MPTRRPTQTKTKGSDRGAGPVTVSIPQMLDLMAGWSPPEGEFERSRTAWRSYADFLRVYTDARATMIAKWPDRAAGWFAEKLYQQALAQPQADVEVLGRKLHDRLQRTGRC